MASPNNTILETQYITSCTWVLSCELCSKKAYQLGITLIYYIDPYPGISKSQILSSGDKPIEVRLFNGAIGSAYHQLYQPIMPYKDELGLLLNQNIKDKTSQLQAENADLKMKIEELKKKINWNNDINRLQQPSSGMMEINHSE